MVLKFESTSGFPGKLITTQTAGPILEFLIQQVWSGALKFALLASFQMMLKLLVLGPHFENHELSYGVQLSPQEESILSGLEHSFLIVPMPPSLTPHTSNLRDYSPGKMAFKTVTCGMGSQ